jgi:TldD protein
MRRAALTAAAIADGPAREAPVSLRVTEKANRYPVKVSWDDVRPQQKLAVLNGLNDKTFKADERVKKVNISFMDATGVILIADSNGRIVEDAQPMTSIYLSTVAEQDGRRENNSVNLAGRKDMTYYTQERLDRLVEKAIDKTMVLFDAVQPPAGEMPVVLGAGSSGILLHEAIGHGMEADFNRRNVSIYSDKIGKNVAKSFVNIVDEGTQESARGAINIDDEGNQPTRSVLIENGVLGGYMQDRVSAKHFDVSPTGNGRRENFQSVPMPRMTNTVLLAGPHDPEEIVKSVRRGILAKSFGGGQVDISNGDFVFSLTESYLIEDGRVTAPLKNVNLIGNGPETLREVTLLGNDVAISDGIWTCGKDGQSVPVGVGCPTMKIARITVGGTEIS